METLNISDLPPTATSPTVPAPMTYELPEEKILNNSNDLLALLDQYEGCVDVAKRQTVYVTTYPVSDADVQNIS